MASMGLSRNWLSIYLSHTHNQSLSVTHSLRLLLPGASRLVASLTLRHYVKGLLDDQEKPVCISACNN